MEIQGYFTRKGLALSAKLLTGASLTITRVTAGSGSTAEPAEASSLPQPRQALAVNAPTRSGNTATIPVTLAAALAEEDYALTELGVYARDPDEGEILYKVYRLDAPVEITAGSRMVLRFYLEETVSQDLGVTVACSPAGLITEAEFEPVRSAVQRTYAPTRTVALDAAELPAFLNALPRLLTENLILTVSGTLDAPLYLHGFYGPGALRVTADEAAGCVFRQRVTVRDCSVFIQFWDIQMTAPAGLAVNEAFFLVERCSAVRLSGCTITGPGTAETVLGLRANYGSTVICEDCGVNGFHAAVLASQMSAVLVYAGTSGGFSGNAYGAYVWHGGIILLSGSVPDTLGGAGNLKQGGIIAKADGTLL